MLAFLLQLLLRFLQKSIFQCQKTEPFLFDIIDTQDSTMIDIHDVFKVIMNYPLAFENQVNWGSWC